MRSVVLMAAPSVRRNVRTTVAGRVPGLAIAMRVRKAAPVPLSARYLRKRGSAGVQARDRPVPLGRLAEDHAATKQNGEHQGRCPMRRRERSGATLPPQAEPSPLRRRFPGRIVHLDIEGSARCDASGIGSVSQLPIKRSRIEVSLQGAEDLGDPRNFSASATRRDGSERWRAIEVDGCGASGRGGRRPHACEPVGGDICRREELNA